MKFNCRYVPPWLAGRNGHLQTAAYGLLGRAQFVKLSHTRYWLPMKDGAQVTFDVFDPQRRHPKGIKNRRTSMGVFLNQQCFVSSAPF